MTTEIRHSSTWRPALSRAVAEASRRLQEALGCVLALHDVVSWSGGPLGSDLDEKLSFLVSHIDRGPAAVVLGLAVASSEIGPDTWAPIHKLGASSWGHGYAVVLVESPSLRDTGALLAHEIGHIFGGIDREGSGGVMDPRTRGERIDDVNATLIRLHGRRRFGAPDPLEPRLAEPAATLYGMLARVLPGLGGAQARARAVFLYVRLAELRLLEQRWQDVVVLLEHALELDAETVDAWLNLGVARLRLGDLDGAEAATRESLELRPSYPQALLNLGVVAAHRDDLPGAARRYEMAVQADPGYADAYLNLGHARLALGELDAAERAYRHALDLGGPAASIHGKLAMIHLARDETQPAEAELQAAGDPAFDPIREMLKTSLHRELRRRQEREREHRYRNEPPREHEDPS